MRTNPITRRLLAATAVFGMCLLIVAPFVAGADPVAGSVGWQPLTTSGPSPRSHAAVAFDPLRGTTVLYGGRAGSSVLGDTWTWDGKSWTEQKPASSPPRLQSAAMAFDDATQQLLLFGGLTDRGAPSAATWVWNGQSWQQLTLLSTPPARYDASFVYDPVTRNALLFGGMQVAGRTLADTWQWNGFGWSAVSTTTAPPARAGAGTAFDTVHGLIVLFGGTSGSQLLSDTWTWDGAAWTARNTSPVPAPRLDPAMAFDSLSNSTVLFGGAASGGVPMDDTWSWDGTGWTRADLTTGGPTGRSGAALAATPGLQGLVLFGGAGLNGVVSGDMWTLGQLVAAINQPSSTTSVPPAAGGTPTTPPSTTVPPTTGEAAGPTSRSAPLGITARSLHKGDQLTISGSGFRPGAEITIEFHSTPIVLALVHADDRGDFTTTVAVPTDATPGTHHFVASGPGPNGAQTLLTAPISVILPARDHDWVVPALMVALTVMLAVGAATVLTLSSRWPERSERPTPA